MSTREPTIVLLRSLPLKRAVNGSFLTGFGFVTSTGGSGLPVDFSFAMQKSLSIFTVFSHLVVKWYIFMAILFFGSIFYKKNAGIKMGLFGFGVIMLIALIMGIMFLILGNNINWEIDLSTYDFSAYYESIAGVLITLFFISLSYLRLTEEQA